MLCYVVLNCACSSASANNSYFGLAIGMVIAAGGYSVGAISGACLNPAVSLGIDVSSADKGFGISLAYIVFQLIGAGIAAGLFRVVRAEDYGGQGLSTTAKLVSEFVGTYMLVSAVLELRCLSSLSDIRRGVYFSKIAPCRPHRPLGASTTGNVKPG